MKRVQPLVNSAYWSRTLKGCEAVPRLPSTHLSLHYHVVFSSLIANRVDHHRDKTFEEEYLELLRLSGVDFDDRYLW